MFDPFSLPGPTFLLFYIALAVAVVLVLLALYRWIELVEEPRLPALTDPYLIAMLRRGPKEAMRVGIFSLVDRGLLAVNDNKLSTKRKNSVGLAQRPFEKAILSRYVRSGAPSAIFSDGGALAASREYRQVLANHGLIADRAVYTKRLLPTLSALFVLIGTSMHKIDIALAQGRHNIGFLIVLTIAFSIAVLFVFCRRRTARGNAVLADLKRLFGRLQKRSGTLVAGGRTNEAALVASLFGIAALSPSTFPFLEKIYPRPSAGSGDSSCSSGSSSSSCGGGGGGGCGGCGS